MSTSPVLTDVPSVTEVTSALSSNLAIALSLFPIIPIATPTPPKFNSRCAVLRKDNPSKLIHFSIPKAIESVLPGNTSAFLSFMRLPTELRWRIWELALPNRLLMVHEKVKTLPDGTQKHMIAVHQPLRTLSFVCKEAHRQSMRFYHDISMPGLGWPLTYAPGYDTLCFNTAFTNRTSVWSVQEFNEDIRALGLPTPSIAIDLDLVQPILHRDECLHFTEIFFIVGGAQHETRVKLLNPADPVPLGGGKWGRGTVREQERRAKDTTKYMYGISRQLREPEYVGKGFEMPVVKLMVLCEKEVGIWKRKVRKPRRRRAY